MKKAFTLIELLVVVAIIAILAGILFPVFASAKDAAKAAVSLSNVKQLSMAILQYSADNEDVFPLALREESLLSQNTVYPDEGGFHLVTTPGGIIPWQESIYPYTRNRDIFASPLGPAVSGSGPIKQFEQANYFGVVPRAQAMAYKDSTGRFLLRTALSDQGNGAYIDGPFGAAASGDAAVVTVYNTPSMTQTSIEHISDVIMISDAGAFDMGFLTTTVAPTGSATTPACTDAVLPNPVTQFNPQAVYAGPWARRIVTGNYSGGSNCVYSSTQRGSSIVGLCDGSARKADMSKIYQSKAVNGYRVYPHMYVGSVD